MTFSFGSIRINCAPSGPVGWTRPRLLEKSHSTEASRGNQEELLAPEKDGENALAGRRPRDTMADGSGVVRHFELIDTKVVI